MAKSPDAFRTISEVATDLDVPQHVLRFWETKFSQIKPLKRAGSRRYYRPEDVDLLRGIRILLYTDGFTIKGVQKVFRDQGVKVVAETGRQRGANGAVRSALQAALAQAPSLPLAPPAKGKDNGAVPALADMLTLLTETKALLGRRRARAATAPARPAAASRTSA